VCVERGRFRGRGEAHVLWNISAKGKQFKLNGGGDWDCSMLEVEASPKECFTCLAKIEKGRGRPEVPSCFFYMGRGNASLSLFRTVGLEFQWITAEN